jgi:hypothetical protein
VIGGLQEKAATCPTGFVRHADFLDDLDRILREAADVIVVARGEPPKQR